MRYVRANTSFNIYDHGPVSDLGFCHGQGMVCFHILRLLEMSIKVLPSDHVLVQLVRHPLEHKLPPFLLPTLPRSAVLQIALVLALALPLTDGVDLIRNQDLKGLYVEKLHFLLAKSPTVQ